MGPNHDHQPELSPATALSNVEVPGKSSETSLNRPGRTPESFVSEGAQQAPPTPTQPVVQTTMASVNPSLVADTPADKPVQNSSNPALAADKDLIEKEWVLKAKQIVQSTQNDPHKQTRDINLFKADYLKKRYNKELKVIDE